MKHPDARYTDEIAADIAREKNAAAKEKTEGHSGAEVCSSSFCPTCGHPWPKEKTYKRIKKGTTVKHLKRGWIGQVFSYDQCEQGTCDVDFGKHGKWCEHFRWLEIVADNH